MNKEPLLVILGSKESLSDSIYQEITSQNDNLNTLSILIPKPLTSITQKMYAIQIPQFESNSFSQYPSNLFPILQGFQENLNLHIFQLVICLKYSDNVTNLMEIIIKNIKSQTYLQTNKFLTFIINDSKNEIFDRKKTQSNKYISQECNLIEYRQNLDVPSLIKGAWKYYDYDSISFYQSVPSGSVQTLKNDLINTWLQQLDNKENDTIAKYLDMLVQFGEQIIKEKLQSSLFNKDSMTDLYSELLCLYVLLLKEINQSQRLQKKCEQENYIKNCAICRDCHVLYSWTSSRQYILSSPFQISLQEKKITDNGRKKCINCSADLSNQKNKFLEFLQKSIVNQSLKCYLAFCKTQFEGTIFLQNNVQEKLKNQKFLQVPSDQNKQLNVHQELQQQYSQDTKGVYQPENLSLPIQSKKIKIAKLGIFLSCENEEKSKIFQTLNDQGSAFDQIKLFKKFRISKLIDVNDNNFQVVDSPIFNFDEDFFETTSIFKAFLQNYEIHMIFFFLDHQRIPLMKENLAQMLDKFFNIERERMAVVITQWEREKVDSNEEKKICLMIKSFGIEKQIFIGRNDDSQLLLTQFISCIDEIDTKCISFENTLFAQCSEEEKLEKEELDKQLNQIASNAFSIRVNDLKMKLEQQKQEALKLKNEEQNINEKIKQLYRQQQDQNRKILDLNLEIRETERQLNQAEYQQKNQKSFISGNCDPQSQQNKNQKRHSNKQIK